MAWRSSKKRKVPWDQDACNVLAQAWHASRPRAVADAMHKHGCSSLVAGVDPWAGASSRQVESNAWLLKPVLEAHRPRGPSQYVLIDNMLCWHALAAESRDILFPTRVGSPLEEAAAAEASKLGTLLTYARRIATNNPLASRSKVSPPSIRNCKVHRVTRASGLHWDSSGASHCLAL